MLPLEKPHLLTMQTSSLGTNTLLMLKLPSKVLRKFKKPMKLLALNLLLQLKN